MKELLMTAILLVGGSASALACSCSSTVMPLGDTIEKTLTEEFNEGYITLDTRTVKQYQTMDDIVMEKAFQMINLAGGDASLDSCTYRDELSGKIFHNCSNYIYKELHTISLDSGKICEVELKIKQKRKSVSAKVKNVECR